MREDDNEASLAARVLEVEHAILSCAVRWFCADRLVIGGGAVRVKHGRADVPALIVPLAE